MVTILVEHHHYFHGLDGGLSTAQFNELKQFLVNNQGILMDVATKLGQMAQREEQMASDVNAALQRATDNLAQLTDAEESMETLLSTLSQQIRDTAGDATAANALADAIDARTKDVVAATLAGTPAAPGGSGGTGTTSPGGSPTPPDDGSAPPTSRRG